MAGKQFHTLSFSQPLDKKYSENIILPELKDIGNDDPRFIHNSDKSELVNYISSKLPAADRREVELEFKKTLVLAAQKPKGGRKKKTKRDGKKQLSAKEKKVLGLSKLPKTGVLTYSSLLPLHTLWSGYVKELLEIGVLKRQGWSPNLMEEQRQLQLQMRICRADLHGALLKVVAALCPSHVSVEGLVAMETKNTLQILSKDNKLRLIPKLGSTFTFSLEGYLFTLPGASIDSKPADRATKKLKNKLPMDF